MRGLISLPANIIGYIVVLAIFIGIMAMIAVFWFNIQTIPRETPEKATACDLGYVLSLWKDATVYPNIFNKSFLKNWSGEGANKTANSIFENMSEFFLPRSDFFLYISDGEDVYSLYVPPESKSVYEDCGNLKISEKDYEKLGENIRKYITKSGNIDIIKGKPGEIPHNRLYSICPLTTFIAEDNDVKIGTMVTGLTTNLATLLREGIYKVGVKGEENVFYRLGPYPEGCLVLDSSRKVETKKEVSSIKDKIIGFIKGIWDWITGKISGGVRWVTQKWVHADCGFSWDWNNTTNVLTIAPVSYGNKCYLKTRIPKAVINESNLSAKICKPRKISSSIFDLKGNLKKYEFFLLVENLKPKKGWSKEKQLELCQRKCEEEPPYIGMQKVCSDFCLEYYNDNTKLNNPTYCYEARRSGDITTCKIARNYYLLYQKLPFDAIDIKYIIVEKEKLAEHKDIDKIVQEKKYYDIKSACSTWPGVFNCTVAGDCHGTYCVNGECSSCSFDNIYEPCSPNYFENPPSINEGKFICQSVTNQSWPSKGIMYECLPMIFVNKTFNGREIDSIDCSESGYENAVVTWKINATDLCCDKLITTSEGKLECETRSSFCQKMKLWPNINSSNVVVLNDENYVFNITQKVCRNGYPYNNANKAFIVVQYPVKNRIIEYSLMGSEVEIGKIKKCNNVSTTKILKDGECAAKVQGFGNYTKVWAVKYKNSNCNFVNSIIKNGNSESYCNGRCKITYYKPNACLKDLS